jgi:galactokinase
MYRAPGRVNLIGEHTDYNDGLVLPIALDRSTWVEATPRVDRRVTAHSREQDGAADIDLDRPPAGRSGSWTDYVSGVAVVLDRTLRLTGADLEIHSDVPIGAGLSSSAALEVACGVALLDVSGAGLDRTALARACQQAEHEFAGTRCGLMDQFTACHGRAGHALLLDMRSLVVEAVPLPSTLRIVICNTMVRHHLASAAYNKRRADCETAVRLLASRRPGIRALRDVTMTDVDAAAADLGDRVYRRCRHVIGENDRVLQAAEALRAGDGARFGRLMAMSHESLRDDFEVSCPELNAMVEIASALDGVYGARMTGGGFGGCAIALVETNAVDDVVRRVPPNFESLTGLRPDVWATSAGESAGKWTEPLTTAADYAD